jgi:hypothetical protein
MLPEHRMPIRGDGQSSPQALLTLVVDSLESRATTGRALRVFLPPPLNRQKSGREPHPCCYLRQLYTTGKLAIRVVCLISQTRPKSLPTPHHLWVQYCRQLGKHPQRIREAGRKTHPHVIVDNPCHTHTNTIPCPYHTATGQLPQPSLADSARRPIIRKARRVQLRELCRRFDVMKAKGWNEMNGNWQDSPGTTDRDHDRFS